MGKDDVPPADVGKDSDRSCRGGGDDRGLARLYRRLGDRSAIATTRVGAVVVVGAVGPAVAMTLTMACSLFVTFAWSSYCCCL